MKTRIFSLLIAWTLLVTQLTAAIAQGQITQASGRDWSAVQTITVDERLIVKQKNGKTIEGKMIEATDTNLTLSSNNKVVNISRDTVKQIWQSRGKAAKGKWALIGAVIGATAGGGIGYAKLSSSDDSGEKWFPIGLIFGTGAGAATGLLLGASQRKQTLIYEAP